ncbi:MAG: alkane 1-monooxygenase [Pseudomonadota bacterium]
MTPRTPASTALPYCIVLALIPLLGAGMAWGGLWIVGAFLFTFLATPLMDTLVPLNASNADPATEDDAIKAHLWLTWFWVPCQVALIVGLLVVAGDGTLAGWELWAMAATLGLATGGIGITYAHELMHQRNRFERWLAEVLMCSTLYGHFCIEHVFGHHLHVATPRDPASARPGESLYRFLPRTVIGTLRSAWAIQSEQLRRRELPLWSRQNAFWRYGAWTAAWITLAYLVAGLTGLGVFLVQAVVAVLLLETVNYLEHYGLQRRLLENGRYEPTREHHSWNANHRFTNYMLINLQRHSDHHRHPNRRFPLLQAHDPDTAPQLPYGYSWMVVLALLPPIWFRVMDPRVAAWRARHGDIRGTGGPNDGSASALPAGAVAAE